MANFPPTVYSKIQDETHIEERTECRKKSVLGGSESAWSTHNAQDGDLL